MKIQPGGTVNTFFAFILGILVGWLIEWVIDFFYWRRRSARHDANLSSRRASIAEANNQIVPGSGAPIRRDDLKTIKGIGVVIEGKLNTAGIYTFEQLGRLTSVELKQILGTVIERLADEDFLLEQARRLAQGRGK